MIRIDRDKHQSMNFAERIIWHPQVRQRLGETLFYFLVRVSPFDINQITARLNKFFLDKHIGGVRVYPIFGTYDLMIRVWLHPSTGITFRTGLDSSLGGTSHSMQPFAVEHIDLMWYDRDREVTRELLESLDEDTIRAVQTRMNQPMLQRLMDAGLVLLESEIPGTTINLFIAIYLEAGNLSILADAVAQIKSFLSAHSEIRNPSVYRGFGFCSILVRCQVIDYFNIATFQNWIGETFKVFGVRAETYLAQGPKPIINNETIGEATFWALRGKDLLVHSILPELYEINSPKRPEVERFLIEELREKHLTQQDKKLLHDYLIGYLSNDPTQMAMVIFAFFAQLENYLRRNYKEFLGRKSGRPPKEMLEEAGIEESKKFLSFVDILRLYSMIVDNAGQGELADKAKDWPELANLRNAVAHGTTDFLSNWTQPLEVLIRYLPRVRELICLFEDVTDNPYSGPY
jgi:hypothetical protein